jgi:hypothetical protein
MCQEAVMLTVSRISGIQQFDVPQLAKGKEKNATQE